MNNPEEFHKCIDLVSENFTLTTPEGRKWSKFHGIILEEFLEIKDFENIGVTTEDVFDVYGHAYQNPPKNARKIVLDNGVTERLNMHEHGDQFLPGIEVRGGITVGGLTKIMMFELCLKNRTPIRVFIPLPHGSFLLFGKHSSGDE